ncbi:MAG: hypothetical protein ACJAWL_003585 [Motiliproteus sp.]|jgi:hypothetical protein
MTGTSKNIRSLSNGPACEKDQLIVQLAGSAHPDGQRVVIYDQSNAQQQEFLEQQRTEEPVADTRLLLWPWENRPPRNLWLEIDADQGPPIRVPLLDNAQQTPRQPFWQDNVLLPVIPLSALPVTNPHSDDNGLVITRPGFLYLFWEGRLWREIAISLEGDSPRYRDVRLADYRQVNSLTGALSADPRPAVGTALEEVWIPARLQGRWLNNQISVAFSDIQWHGPYINWLEQGEESTLGRRTQPIQEFSRLGAVYGGPLEQLVSLNSVKPHWGREPLTELQLTDPAALLRDLDGEWLNRLHRLAQQERLELDRDARSAFEVLHNSAIQNRLGQEIVVRQQVLDETLGNAEPDPLWTSNAPGGDVLQGCRSRNIWGLVVADPHFRVRHAAKQTLAAQQYLQALMAHCGNSAHAKSAQLVKQLILPSQLGKKDNPYHELAEHLDTGIVGTLSGALRTGERRRLHGWIETLRSKALRVAQDRAQQEALRDYAARDDCERLCCYMLVGELAQALVVNSGSLDYLLAESDRRQRWAPGLQELERLLSEGSDHPLHAQLFYTPAAALPAGQHNGHFRQDWLQTLTDSDQTPSVEQAESLETAALLSLADQGAFDYPDFATLRRGAGLFDGALGALSGVLPLLRNQLAPELLELRTNKLYGPLVELFRRAMPGTLGEISLVARNSLAATKGYMVGVDGAGLKHGLTDAERTYAHKGRSKFYGEIELDGKPVGGTNESLLRRAGVATDARLAAPGQGIKLYYLPSTGDGFKDLQRINQLRRGFQAKKITAALHLPAILTVIELINLNKEIEAFSKARLVRGGFGSVSAVGDLSIALAKTGAFYAGEASVWAQAVNKELIHINPVVATRWFGEKVGGSLARSISRVAFAGFAAGVLTVGISVTDMIYAINSKDLDSAAANAMIAAGTLTATLVATLMAPGAILLGLGPLGWIVLGIGVAITGGIALAYTQDSPLQQWLLRGPFGNQADGADDSLYLLQQDPALAYRQLLGLLISVQIDVRHRLDDLTWTPGMAPAAGLLPLPLDTSAEVIGRLQLCDTLVRVRSNLPQLSSDPADYRVHIGKQTRVEWLNPMGSQTYYKDDFARIKAVVTIKRPEGEDHYLQGHRDIDLKQTTARETKHTHEVSEWRVRVQLQAAGGRFPTAQLLLGSDAPQHAAPDFTSRRAQPYWADEINHPLAHPPESS